MLLFTFFSPHHSWNAQTRLHWTLTPCISSIYLWFNLLEFLWYLNQGCSTGSLQGVNMWPPMWHLTTAALIALPAVAAGDLTFLLLPQLLLHVPAHTAGQCGMAQSSTQCQGSWQLTVPMWCGAGWESPWSWRWGNVPHCMGEHLSVCVLQQDETVQSACMWCGGCFSEDLAPTSEKKRLLPILTLKILARNKIWPWFPKAFSHLCLWLVHKNRRRFS